MSTPDTAIVDVDGTLADSNYHHALAWFRAFRSLLRSRWEDEVYDGLIDLAADLDNTAFTGVPARSGQ